MNRSRLVLPFLCAPAVLSQQILELEPNDTAATAQAVPVGRQVRAVLGAGDADWYGFTIAAGAEVHARTGYQFGATAFDTVVLLFDATGTVRLAWNDQQPGPHADAGVQLPAGDYTALVLGKDPTQAGNYVLDLVALPPTAVTVPEGPEPNHGPAAGGQPTPFVPGAVLGGRLPVPGDADWFVFTVAGRSVLFASLLDDGPAPQLDAPLVSVLQQAGASWSHLVIHAANGTHRLLDAGAGVTLSPGSYAIEVSARTPSGTPPFDYRSTGHYALRTQLVALPDAPSFAEGPEPNSASATATPIAIGCVATGHLALQDVDRYRFDVAGPTAIVAVTEDGNGSPITDTTLVLRDGDGAQVLAVGSGGTASHARLVATLPEAGTWFVDVRTGNSFAQGSYLLRLGGGPALAAPAWFRSLSTSLGCRGSDGRSPVLGALTDELPQLGSTFVPLVHFALPNAIVLSSLGLSATSANGGTVALPLPLPGAPGCLLRVDPLVLLLGVADAQGLLDVPVALPAVLALRGQPVHLQALLADPANNALGVSVTNPMRLVLGERGF